MRERTHQGTAATEPGRSLRAAGTTLWSEDFENGLGDWTVNTSAGNVDWQLTTTGNTGGFTPGPLESSTGYPGGKWIVADSDQQGTAGIGENTTITSGGITGFDTVAYMLLTFEQSFRQLNDDETTVEVSGNGGVTWTVFPVNTNVPGNQSTPGAPASEHVTLNISSALNGGASDIRIRFRWVSTEGFTYSWQVDDLALVEASDNDLRLTSSTHAAWDLNESDFRGLPYTIYPENEVRELKFRARVTNNGAATQHNVRLQVSIDGPGNNDATLTSAAVDLAPVSEDSLFIAGYTPPTVIGEYAITYTILQDETEDEPADNVAAGIFEVSPYTFARDEGATDGGYDNQGDEYELGNWFHVIDWDNTLYGIDVAVTNQSDVGAPIRAIVYDTDRNFLAETEEYFIQASDLNSIGQTKFITLPLIDPLALDMDADYLITTHHYGGTEEVWVATSGTSSEQTSLILDYSNGNWFYVTNTPMVRMNLSPAVGIDEGSASLHGATVQPSLFTDRVELRFALYKSSKVSVAVHDAAGRLIRQYDLGSLASGQQRFDMDLRDLGAGSYTCSVQAGGERTNMRMVKQ